MKKFKFLLIPKSNNFREIININEISYQLKTQLPYIKISNW